MSTQSKMLRAGMFGNNCEQILRGMPTSRLMRWHPTAYETNEVSVSYEFTQIARLDING